MANSPVPAAVAPIAADPVAATNGAGISKQRTSPTK